jgi:ribose/xylose/arabinose/galactoside ABC-type transport system permease subunit
MRAKLNASGLQKLVLLGILVGISLVFTFTTRGFFSLPNWSNILRLSSFVIVTGSGVTLLMIARNVDLSVGSTLALTHVLFAIFCRAGIPVVPAILLTLASGALIGFLNGVLVVRLKITPFIATLGTLYMLRGFTLIITGAKSVRENLPPAFSLLGRGSLGPLPVPLLVILGVVVLFVLLERRSLLGKYAIAIGGNPLAAELSGINVNRIVWGLFVVVGLLAGLSGVLIASWMGVAEPNIGSGFEFDVIIAVVLGGTSLAGGEGSVLGMLIGALIVEVIGNGLNQLNVLSFYQSVLKGIILVLAVLLDRQLKGLFLRGRAAAVTAKQRSGERS